MQTSISSYEQQAIDFLAVTNTSFSVEYLRTGKYFADDKHERDIYSITLKRGAREYKFEFGNSINESGKYIISTYIANALKIKSTRRFASESEIKKLGYINKQPHDIVKNVHFAAPNAYDVLACLTKYEVGAFEDFCNEYGYDTDSRKAEKTYLAVKDEWLNVSRLFNDSEIEQLQEIQ